MNMFSALSLARGARALCMLAAIGATVAGVSACSDKNKDKKVSQALASVNGDEITTLQLNEELQRANIAPAQQEAASKQLLQALVDRQLLQNAAAREQVERDPKVMQAIERAKALIIAQAYLQKRVGNQLPPSREAIAAYYAAHPAFFAQRKLLSLNQLVVGADALTPAARAVADAARSLDDVAVWLDAHRVPYSRGQSTRSVSELAPALASKLLALTKGQLFLLKEGERAMLVTVNEVKVSPLTLEQATPQITQFLVAKQAREVAEAELARLRASARIDYLNKSLALAQPSAAAAAGSAAKAGDSDDKAAIARGVAGLK
jgi:peptidyl-prolyl cis-trans isomerase C